MPFDVLSIDWPGHIVEQTDPLALLGIEPIPQDAVKAYKAAYRRKIVSTPKFKAYADLIRWRTERRNRRSVSDFLIDPLANVYSGPDWQENGMPAPLHQLARRVHAELPAAEFSVDYLSGDPILQVGYEFGGKKTKACLGIWENGEIKMIAKT